MCSIIRQGKASRSGTTHEKCLKIETQWVNTHTHTNQKKAVVALATLLIAAARHERTTMGGGGVVVGQTKRGSWIRAERHTDPVRSEHVLVVNRKRSRRSTADEANSLAASGSLSLFLPLSWGPFPSYTHTHTHTMGHSWACCKCQSGKNPEIRRTATPTYNAYAYTLRAKSTQVVDLRSSQHAFSVSRSLWLSRVVLRSCSLCALLSSLLFLCYWQTRPALARL